MVDNEADLRQIEGGQVRTKVLDDGWGRGHLRGVDCFKARAIAGFAGALVLTAGRGARSYGVCGGDSRPAEIFVGPDAAANGDSRPSR